MKRYKIVHESGHSCEIEAEDRKELAVKINSGKYQILPIGEKVPIPLSSDTVTEIIELAK